MLDPRTVTISVQPPVQARLAAGQDVPAPEAWEILLISALTAKSHSCRAFLVRVDARFRFLCGDQ